MPMTAFRRLKSLDEIIAQHHDDRDGRHIHQKMNVVDQNEDHRTEGGRYHKGDRTRRPGSRFDGRRHGELPDHAHRQLTDERFCLSLERRRGLGGILRRSSTRVGHRTVAASGRAPRGRRHGALCGPADPGGGRGRAPGGPRRARRLTPHCGLGSGGRGPERSPDDGVRHRHLLRLAPLLDEDGRSSERCC